MKFLPTSFKTFGILHDHIYVLFINYLNYSTYFLFLVCEMSQLCVHFFTVLYGVLNEDVINLNQLYRQYLCCVREAGLLTYT